MADFQAFPVFSDGVSVAATPVADEPAVGDNKAVAGESTAVVSDDAEISGAVCVLRYSAAGVSKESFVVAAAADPVEPLVLKGKALREAERLARGQLAEVTEVQTVGALLEVVPQPGTCSANLVFACEQLAYTGWQWVVTVSRLAANAPITVAELGLLPGEGALVAPEWVPWSQRLAEYREARAAEAAEEAIAAALAHAELDEDDVDAEDDLLENDFTDFDDEINGVDIDSIDFSEIELDASIDSDTDD